MRIAYLTQSYPPMVSGAALVVQRFAEGMAARGHSVLVLAASDQLKAYTEEHDCLRVARLHSLYNPLRVGQRFLVWPQYSITVELRAFQPDIVHWHDPSALGLAGLRAVRRFNSHARRVLTVHQLPWFVSLLAPPVPGLRRGLESLLWSYGSWLYRYFDAVITPSQTIADLVEAHTRCRPQPIGNGVETDRFSPVPATPDEAASLRRKYHLDPDWPIVLYVGRVDVDKRVDLVLQAVARALRSTPAQLLVVGDGRQLSAIMELSEMLGIRPCCHFPGFVSRESDLPGLYRIASVFATASEVEIQSSVVLEAMAAGLPVVTVRASSMPEFVQDGETGYLVPPRDVEAMADRILTLLQNPAQARAMGEAARTLALKYSHESALAEHERLYESLIHHRL